MQVNRPIQVLPGQLRCPRCFALDIAPSLPRGLLDKLMQRFGRIPRHCRVCGRRFYSRMSRTGLRPAE